jgi:hypothetical protein
MSSGPLGAFDAPDFMDAMADPRAAQQYQGGGLLANLNTFAQQNSGGLLGLGLGLMSGDLNAAAQNFTTGNRQDFLRRQLKAKEHEDIQKRTAAQSIAQQMGLPPELAGDPDTVLGLYKTVQANKLTREPTEWERLTQGLSADELQKARRYRLGLETKPATTDDMVEYELAKKDPAFAAYQRSLKGGTNAPSGYTYGPDGRLAPIPGGPQDPERDINEPLPGEIGARVGLANEYFKRFPRIEADLRSKDPRAVGPVDGLGFGQSGAIQRDIKLGSEAMIRMLTGAGMNKDEAENEVKQYLPGRGDDAATVLDKQYRLRAALRSMQREMLTGRRSRRQIDELYPELESPEFSEVEKRASSGKRVPLGAGRATYGATPGSGRTTTGVPWSYSR